MTICSLVFAPLKEKLLTGKRILRHWGVYMWKFHFQASICLLRLSTLIWPVKIAAGLLKEVIVSILVLISFLFTSINLASPPNLLLIITGYFIMKFKVLVSPPKHTKSEKLLIINYKSKPEIFTNIPTVYSGDITYYSFITMYFILKFKVLVRILLWTHNSWKTFPQII